MAWYSQIVSNICQGCLEWLVENKLPEKIERLVRCEASAYQKLLMQRVDDNLGAFGVSKVHFAIN
ncbi:hypothetical protein Hanom_Chr10g00913191 [Helianthus anomalus]